MPRNRVPLCPYCHRRIIPARTHIGGQLRHFVNVRPDSVGPDAQAYVWRLDRDALQRESDRTIINYDPANWTRPPQLVLIAHACKTEAGQ